MMRYGGLLGIVLAAVVGVLVLQTNQSQPTSIEPTSVTEIASLATAMSPTRTSQPSATAPNTEPPITVIQTIRGVVGDTNVPSDVLQPSITWVGDPIRGLRREGRIPIGSDLTILSKAQFRQAWFLQVTSSDGAMFWIVASDVTLSDGVTLDGVPEWEG
jgi:hypothetical protein